jgi:tetratricopeptide (TPR) repeat protein
LKTVTVLVVVLFAGLSMTRNRAWSDDATLALTDVHTSSGSAKANMAAGAALIERGIALPEGAERTAALEEAEGYLLRAIRIHPTYLQALDLLGTTRFHQGALDSSYAAYRRCLAAGGARVGSVGCLDNLEALGDLARTQGRLDLAVTCYQEVLAVRETGSLRAKLGQLHGRERGDIAGAITELRRARELEPGNPAILMDLGVAYASSGRFAEAAEVLEAARDRDPSNPALLNNLARVYDGLGDADRAREVRARLGGGP